MSADAASDSFRSVEPTPGAGRDAAREPIAVIGMACRLPGAEDYRAFWHNLAAGRSSVTEVPEDRWSKATYYSADRSEGNKTVSKWGGFIDGVDRFDAPLFRLSPREAELMDPQQRIALELAWSCFEDAGYAPSALRGADVGVYIGIGNFDYKSRVENALEEIEAHVSTGVHMSLVANRISYEFDFKGPSLAVDTACSGSLVALDEAVHALRRGDCTAALVGGVSVLCTPTHFVSFSKTGMLSPAGRCKTFDADADGYVRGEGVGLLLLKPLSAALRDGDAVHGVIRGVGVTHGGRATTLTSPNPFAQSQAIVKAFRNAGLSPEDVTYVEAHGTGTPKGDPIEVTGLVRAYSTLAKAKGIALKPRSCGIGSVKTNIGHLEPAAGVAGVIKVLLAMKHGVLPPLLHFERINPRIKFEGSPFHLITETTAWEPSADGVRRAGVSSFGFGGVNAHVLIEEFRRPEAAAPDEAGAGQPQLFLVSAKTRDSLTHYLQRLRAYLSECRPGAAAAPDESPFSLAALAAALERREAMDERMAIQADTLDGLLARLDRAIAGGEDEGVWRGNAKQGPDWAALGGGDRDPEAVLAEWLAARRLAPLAQAWVRGASWGRVSSVHGAGAAAAKHRLRLPTYAFARRRYWFDDGRTLRQPASASAGATPQAAMLHPLVHRNTSTLSGTRFSSRFHGDEFFLRDHVVRGQRVLPGAAYLEIAREAMRLAQDAANAEDVLRIARVVWLRPLTVDAGPVEVHVDLQPGADGQARFEVSSRAAGAEPVLHAEGQIQSLGTRASGVLDLPALRRRFEAGARDVAPLYAQFERMGLQYGPAHRGVAALWTARSDGDRLEVLARLRLPAAASEAACGYVLHPSLIDAALQASLAAAWSDVDADAATSAALVPFSVDSVDVYAPAAMAEGDLYAWIRSAADGTRTAARAPMERPFEFDLCDEQGRVCVAMRGFVYRAAGGHGATGLRPPETPALSFVPHWHRLDGVAPGASSFRQRHLVLAGWRGPWAEGGMGPLLPLQAQVDGTARLHDVAADTATAAGLAVEFERQSRALFALVQALLRSPNATGTPDLVQVLVPDDLDNMPFHGLAGLLKTARLEQPRLIAQLVRVAPTLGADAIRGALHDLAAYPDVAVARVEADGAWAQGWTELGATDTTVGAARGTAVAWKEGGVYLITGGAGGLGRRLAADLGATVRQATLVLVGRSAPGPEQRRAMDDLLGRGVKAEYRQADVADPAAVAALVDDVRARFGRLDGVVHCAGVLRDRYIVQKEVEDFRDVFAAKVAGTVNLDEATRDVGLDFFALFSSTAAALGNPGQVDYAAANGFLDAFAHRRNALRAQGRRQGHAVAIDWPLWRDGGMQVDEATTRMLAERHGMRPLETAAGLTAFHRALAGEDSQVLVVQGDAAVLRRRLLAAPVSASATETAPSLAPAATQAPAAAATDRTAVSTAAQGEDAGRLEHALVAMAATLLKLQSEDIDTRTELSEYGFDSIAYTGLALRISEKYGIDLAPTAFFDYPTIEGIAGHLLAEHAPRLSRTGAKPHPAATAQDAPVAPSAGGAEPAEGASASPGPVPAASVSAVPSPSRFAGERTLGPAPAVEPRRPGAVAVVGMSGCFPMARNLDEFWRNLEQGRDCISEIPAERWDWKALFGDPATQGDRSDVKWGGFIEGVDEFDSLFFGISPREARLMDPQQRLLMTHAWKAIEDAGYSPGSLSGTRTGVFVGTASVGYGQLIAQSGTAIEGYTATATVPSVGPNRMSFLLNLHGPSEPIETACSSSLVAIHRAILAIEAGDCDQAIVGGVNTLVTPELHISFNKAGMLARDGRCKTFSSAANGYVRGEGVGMLFLKRLEDAEDADDPIYGVIRGSAENHGGRANSLTSPSSRSQADVIVRAYRKAGIDPSTVGCIEAHGTGTSLGDPVEINGIKAAFQTLREETPPARSEVPPCALGSVKTNIGHLELAAGVAGVIKVLLQFRHRRLVPSLHCDELNPLIDLKGTPFYVIREARDWEAPVGRDGRPTPLRAGVSSFGFGGVNAHVVLEAHDPAKAVDPSPPTPAVIPISARTPAALREYVAALIEFVRSGPGLSLHALAYTFQVGRDAMDERLAVVAHDADDLLAKLEGHLAGQTDLDDVYRGQVGRHREALSELAHDEDMQATMSAWLDKGKHSKLLGLWVKGVAFDWSAYYRARPSQGLGRRIHAPTYPFARDRHWVTPAAPTSADRPPAQEMSLPAADPVLQTLLALEQGFVDIDQAISALTAETEASA